MLTCYNQDLQISYQNEQAVINDVLDLNDLNQELCVFRNPRWIYEADGTRRLPPATKKEQDLWMEHWIDVYNSRMADGEEGRPVLADEFPGQATPLQEAKSAFRGRHQDYKCSSSALKQLSVCVWARVLSSSSPSRS